MVNKKLSEQIEIIKWLAIIGIFLFHYSDTLMRYDIFPLNSILEKATHIGSQGIHIFFILSAFFLYIKHIENNEKFNILNRLSKLYPQYVISVFFVLGIYYFFGYYFFIDEIIINLLPLIRNFSYDYIRSINGNWWFLHTLIEFYIFFWIIKNYLPKISTLKLASYTLIIYFSYVSFYTYVYNVNSQNLTPFSSFFLNYIYDFTIGIILARIYVNFTKDDFSIIYFSKKINNVSALLIFGIIFELLGLAVTKQFGVFGYNINDIFFAFGILFLLFGVSKFLVNTLILQPYIHFLVKNTAIIYFIYLIHHPIIIVTTSLYEHQNIFYVLFSFVLTGFLTSVSAFLLSKLIFFTPKVKNAN